MNDLVFDVSPLSLNQLTRQYWGQYDPPVIAQLASLASDPCYSLKFYKSPADNQEIFAPGAYVGDGIQFVPGSLIYGLYIPAIVNTTTPTSSAPNQFTVQVIDTSLDHSFWNEPVSSLLLSNFKPTYQTAVSGASAPAGYLNMGSFPNLLTCPHPVVGTGQFEVQIQESGQITQRIQVVFGALVPCDPMTGKEDPRALDRRMLEISSYMGGALYGGRR